MEVSSSLSSCCSPFSIHSRIDFAPPYIPYTRHRVSAKFDCHGHRRYLNVHSKNQKWFPPSCSASGSSNLSAFFGTSLNMSSIRPLYFSRKRSLSIVCGMFERFTEKAIKTVMSSQREAKALGGDMVATHHLLLGLIAEDRAPTGFLGSGITIDAAREAVRSIWHGRDGEIKNVNIDAEASSTTSAADVPFSVSTKRVLEAAVEYSRTLGYNFIAPEHIAIGLFTVDDGGAGRVLERLGASVNAMVDLAIFRLQGELAKDGRELPAVSKPRHEKKSLSGKTTAVYSSDGSKEKSALDLFCMDLTASASAGLIDPVIGRDTEVERIVQILCRKTKSNPILLGEPGVGKTAIAEGLAIRIAEGNVPFFLLTKRIMSLDTGLLISGTKERGELEARVTNLIKELKNSGDIILFIDEVHMLVGSVKGGQGNKGSGLDIGNLLKPSLGRSEFQCIASTTMDEYRSQFEKDEALARRFQPVIVHEPTLDDAVRILLGLRHKYEAYHKCRYTLDAINAAVYLSARYIPDRYLPDKAIDLIDEAGSKARMEAYKRRKEQQTSVLTKSADDYWQEIRAVQAMQELVQASKVNENDNMPRVEDDEKFFLESSSEDYETTVVGSGEIAAVASLWSGIPVQQLTADERMLLVGLNELLRKHVIGQDEAVSAVCRAIKRSRVGLKDPDRPIAAMLFCGPTGVGKTELTKALTASYFGSEEAMIRLDMSEFMERHTVSKLIGAPPGYTGYGEGGTLTEAIRKKPFTVVLIDEIEKAHPDIFNILLQIFEDGHLTDSQGRRVSFKNTLIVMTSNVGSVAISKGRHNSIGFLATDDESTSYSGMKALVMEELKVYFRPELLNRIDEVVVFRPLEKDQMVEILNLMLQELKKRLVPLGIGLELSEAIVNLICKQGFDRSYGARPLRRAVTLIIEDLLSESLLSGDFKSGDVVVLDLDDSGNPIARNRSSQNVLSETASFL